MKKILFISCCFIVISSIEAQTAKTSYQPKREITLRWGAFYDEDWLGHHNDYYYAEYWSSPLDRYNSAKQYAGPRVYSGAISLQYTEELKRWMALCFNVSYSGVYENRHNLLTENVKDKYRSHRLSLLPMVRFTYLNKPTVRLYSALGVGIGFSSEKSDQIRYNDTFMDAHITFFGISVGKKLFASSEIGFGSLGIINAGIGYRF
jgi:hypothetical protein